MVVQPSILLLDEPTAGLSSHETAEVDRLLRRLVEEWRIGVLLVEHDVGLVMSVCDDVVVLNFGEVISTAPPNEARPRSRRHSGLPRRRLVDEKSPEASVTSREPSIG